jgi:hypothetical protein
VSAPKPLETAQASGRASASNISTSASDGLTPEVEDPSALERRGDEPMLEGVPLRALAWLDARVEARLMAEPGGRRAAPSRIVLAAEAYERSRVGLEPARHEAAREALCDVMEAEAMRLAESDEPEVDLVPMSLAYARARKAERLRLEVAPPPHVELAELAGPERAAPSGPASRAATPLGAGLASTPLASTPLASTPLASTPLASTPPASTPRPSEPSLGPAPPALVGVAPPLASPELERPAPPGAGGMPSHLRGTPRPSFMLEPSAAPSSVDHVSSVNSTSNVGGPTSPSAPFVASPPRAPEPPSILAPGLPAAHAAPGGMWTAAASEPTLLGGDPVAAGEELPFKPGVALLPLSAASPPRPTGEAMTEEVDASVFRAALPFSRRDGRGAPSPATGASHLPLSLEQHAALSAELHARPELAEQAYRRHGLAAPSARQPADAAMKAYLAARPDELSRWRGLYAAALARLRQGG